MSYERQPPINYQITVTDVARIGNKSMADFFVSFDSRSSRQWKSPLIHGKITKQNTRFPWTFYADSPNLNANFHEVNEKTGDDRVVGSMPLVLMKREGQQQFLIFGCIQQNRGRKVAQVSLSYVQSSIVKSLNSNKKNEPSSQDGRRVSLEQTIQMENYDSRKMLNVIPEESSHKQSMIESKPPLGQGQSLVEEPQFHPSKLETLKAETNRQRISEDSNFELNLIKEMQDASDKWYRKNFGREKPSNLQSYDFQNDNSRLVSVIYEKDYEYLNDLSLSNPYMEMKNIVISCEKKPKGIEIFSIDMDGSQLIKQKILAMHTPNGHKNEWITPIRLPKEKKAYAIQITTTQKQKLQGLILKDNNNSKNSLDIYNKKGNKVGKVNYSLKQIKKIEIQTMDLMKLQPIPEEREASNQLDKSFLKENKDTTFLKVIDTSFPNRNRNHLMKQVYLNREDQPPENLVIPKNIHYKLEPSELPTKQISNQAYLGRKVSQSPKSKSSFRKNQYEVDSSTKYNRSTFSKYQSEQPTLKPRKKTSIDSKDVSEFNESEQFNLRNGLNSNKDTLARKIEQLKRLGDNIGKKAKHFSNKFLKNAKYKTVVYNQSQSSIENKQNFENSNSNQSLRNTKKTYRQPIDATPSFQSIMVNNTFSKQPQIQNEKVDQSHSKIEAQRIKTYQDMSKNDDSEELPIARHKTADEIVLKALIKQKEIEAKQILQSNRKAQEAEQNEAKRKKASTLGVNTERMSIVNNVLQSTFIPTTPTQRRTSPLLDNLKSIDYQSQKWQNRRNSNEEGSVPESSGDREHTKYSSRTIQPATLQSNGKLSFIVNSISVGYYENMFGNKFMKVYIPNKHYYQTSTANHSNTLFWKCSGFLFSNIHDQQDLYLQLYNSLGEEQKMLGRVIISCKQFNPKIQQGAIRAYLVFESKVVGEIVIGYGAVSKNREKKRGSVERDASNPRQIVSESHFDQSKKQTTLIRQRRKKKQGPDDSLTKFMRKNRKDKINRYMVNEYSRAHIDSRIHPSPQQKYTNGKNIIIGRDIRFAYGPQQEHKHLTPGPGAYKQKSQFERYHYQIYQDKK